MNGWIAIQMTNGNIPRIDGRTRTNGRVDSDGWADGRADGRAGERTGGWTGGLRRTDGTDPDGHTADPDGCFRWTIRQSWTSKHFLLGVKLVPLQLPL